MRRYLLFVLLAALFASLIAPGTAIGDFAVPNFTVLPKPDQTGVVQTGAHADVDITVTICPGNVCPNGTDINDHLKSLAVTFPPGMIGNPNAIPPCSANNFNANPPSCPSSAVGSFAVTTASVSTPYFGTIYNLAHDSSEIARLGLFLDPHVLGVDPFHMQSSISVNDSYTAIATVDNFPNLAKITQLKITLRGMVGSMPFMTNPTSCGAPEASVTATSYPPPSGTGTTATATSDVPAVTGCELLPFAPTVNMTVGAPGETGRGSAPPIDVGVSLPTDNSAIAQSKITFPDSLRPNMAALAAHACAPELQSACPSNSQVGTLTIATPLWSQPISGPIYLTRVPNRLRTGLRAELSGPVPTVINGTGTFDDNRPVASFKDLPDIPVDRVSMSLFGGTRGVFAVVKDICSTAPVAKARLVAQSGKALSIDVPITVEGCGPPSLEIQSKTVTVTSDYAPVTVACLASGSTCRGRLNLTSMTGSARLRGIVRGSVGQASLSVGTGDRKPVGVRISRSVLNALAKRRSLRVVATCTLARGPTVSQRLTLKAAPDSKSKTAPRGGKHRRH